MENIYREERVCMYIYVSCSYADDGFVFGV